MRKLGAAIIVTVALLAFVQTGPLVGYVFIGLGNRNPLWVSLFYLVPALALVAIGALLIANRRRLAERWFEDSEFGLSFDAVQLLRAGLILAGVTFVVQALPGLAGTIESLVGISFPQSQGPQTALSIVRAVTSPVLQIGLGLATIVWSKRLAARLMPLDSDGKGELGAGKDAERQQSSGSDRA